MRKIINLEFILLMFFLLISCSQHDSKIRDKKEDKIQQVEDHKLDNPALFMGSNFGVFLQMCHKTGQDEKMLVFTSSRTRAEFGDSTLLQFFQKIEFSFPLELQALKEENGLIILYYKTSIEATIKTIKLNIVVENDSCKIVLKELNPDNPFAGM